MKMFSAMKIEKSFALITRTYIAFFFTIIVGPACFSVAEAQIILPNPYNFTVGPKPVPSQAAYDSLSYNHDELNFKRRK